MLRIGRSLHLDKGGNGCDRSVYLAQQYGYSSPSWRIRVNKMLGEVLPDLIATQVQAPPTIAHGSSGNVVVTVMNQGDGRCPPSHPTKSKT